MHSIPKSPGGAGISSSVRGSALADCSEAMQVRVLPTRALLMKLDWDYSVGISSLGFLGELIFLVGYGRVILGCAIS